MTIEKKYKLSRRNALIGSIGILASVFYKFNPKLLKGNQMNSKPNHKMPVLFIGHGSPMNAIENNIYSSKWIDIANELPKPQTILCISAHWLSAGTWLTHMVNPKTIHDFYGFPQSLFDVKYPAEGNPKLAEHIQSIIKKPEIKLDDANWGLDHGTWSVLNKMYPEANIPVLQLSIDMSEAPEFHLELGKKLNSLREQGVLILGSGNIVHNLRELSWSKEGQGFDWAIEFDEWSKQMIIDKNYLALAKDYHKTKAGLLSVPTLDHYLPMLYVLGASDSKDNINFHIEGCDKGSLSMRSFTLG